MASDELTTAQMLEHAKAIYSSLRSKMRREAKTKQEITEWRLEVLEPAADLVSWLEVKLDDE